MWALRVSLSTYGSDLPFRSAAFSPTPFFSSSLSVPLVPITLGEEFLFALGDAGEFSPDEVLGSSAGGSGGARGASGIAGRLVGSAGDRLACAMARRVA